MFLKYNTEEQSKKSKEITIELLDYWCADFDSGYWEKYIKNTEELKKLYTYRIIVQSTDLHSCVNSVR